MAALLLRSGGPLGGECRCRRQARQRETRSLKVNKDGGQELSSPAKPDAGEAERSGGEIAQRTTPLRFGDDPYVWASWLYYQEGMTQNDIA